MNDTLGHQVGSKRDVAREAVELGHEDRTFLPVEVFDREHGQSPTDIDYPPGEPPFSGDGRIRS
ncbi:hypothetical protein [Mesorhizobium sp. LjRoot246]|uniref:hypothetical protein n=1 Tax=Mesorhizobium sp. LjRoot246 TaxID=3342294 RepID=UPI003ECD507D